VIASETAEHTLLVVASVAASGSLLSTKTRARRACTVLALLLAPLLVAGQVVGAIPRLSPQVVVAGVLTMAIVVGGLTTLFFVRPQFFPALVVLALPLRLPLQVSGEPIKLLLPLYSVIAAGALANMATRPRMPPNVGFKGTDHMSMRQAPFSPVVTRRLRLLKASLALAVAGYAIQALYSADPGAALKTVAFFYIPFAVLFGTLLDWRWTRTAALLSFGAAVLIGLTAGIIGIIEYVQSEPSPSDLTAIFSNRVRAKVRVDSIFYDPNVYGRYLSIVLILVSTSLLWHRRRRETVVAGLIFAVLAAGLWVSFSRSSAVSLLAGVAVLAGLRWRLRRLLYLAAAGLATGLLLFVTVFAPAYKDLRSESLDRVTTGRVDLVTIGLRLFVSSPVVGHGSGSFERASAVLTGPGGAGRKSSRSHTTPVTIAAEQGTAGLAVYAALLLTSSAVLFSGLPAPIRRVDPFLIARAALAAVFVAMLVHTLVYAAFLEDPATWTVLALGALASCKAGSECCTERRVRSADGCKELGRGRS
jgi:putative inorganic carbon (HCO3(-)) transporter